MRTVLIADDSKTSQMLVKTTLQRIPDLKFLTADNGAEALTVVRNSHVDLLVTDINMPEMDGIALVRAVRETHDQRALPILIITAKGEEAARDQGLALGANGYVLKPLSTRELTELATQLLASPARGRA
jgi:two-component system chemotaxis response regulator CheY